MTTKEETAFAAGYEASMRNASRAARANKTVKHIVASTYGLRNDLWMVRCILQAFEAGYDAYGSDNAPRAAA